MKSETVVLLTGGSSGIGQCTARYLAEAGCRVYELSRRDSSQPGIIHLTCDVTREEQVQAAVKTVAEREGRIDIVVNNAGFGISGAVEFTQTADAQRLLDVNFFGMVRVNRAVLPYMREAGRGRIVNLSSVAAVAPQPPSSSNDTAPRQSAHFQLFRMFTPLVFLFSRFFLLYF